MISEINIPIKKFTNGYYLRWYYNGWHYWHFLPGKESIQTVGQLYNTIVKKPISISSGPVNYLQVVAIRTITCSKEVALYTDNGWMTTLVSPGSFEVSNNYLNGYEIELTIVSGSREVSSTGYSPAIIPPSPSKPLYGLLYNYYAVSDIRGLAPEGWHIVTFTEMLVLYESLPIVFYEFRDPSSINEAGTEHWNAPNLSTNETGLTILPAGYRHYNSELNFQDINTYAAFWLTDTPSKASIFTNYLDITEISYTDYIFGYSVRCIRDNNTGWVEGEQITDIDGNVYDTVKIGDQIWLKQNLAVTHFKNGVAIPEVKDITTWGAATSPALCAYNNDWSNVFI
jgi:uncharacterized protein (TIGR02145 family)